MPDARNKKLHPDDRSQRRLALRTLEAVLSGRRRAGRMLDTLFRRHRLPAADRALVQELVGGCIRRKATLDAIITAYASRPAPDLDDTVRNILRLGVYQIVFMDRIPAHAAVNESVELAAGSGRGRAKGFVNAVLRQISREVVFLDTPPAGVSRRVIPRREGGSCEFARDVLPDPNDRASFYGASHSHPSWLVQRWLSAFGEERTVDILAADNEPGPVFLRPNTTRIGIEELRERLGAAGVPAAPSPSGRTLRLEERVNVSALKVLREGLCLVQDDSAAGVVPQMEPAPGLRVLDLCAAPGGKTCQIAESVGPGGSVVAVEVSAERAERINENAGRLGLDNIRVVVADARELGTRVIGEPFDRVLVDVPCTNTGVLRRRVEARWRLRPEDLDDLPQLQFELARAGARALRPGGCIVYSTCSLEAEENSIVVERLRDEIPSLRLEARALAFPQIGGGDGAFWARLRKE